MAVAAAAQYPVKGAAMTAAGGAADEVETTILVQTTVDGIQRVDVCSCVVAAAAHDAAERSRWSCS